MELELPSLPRVPMQDLGLSIHFFREGSFTAAPLYVSWSSYVPDTSFESISLLYKLHVYLHMREGVFCLSVISIDCKPVVVNLWILTLWGLHIRYQIFTLHFITVANL